MYPFIKAERIVMDYIWCVEYDGVGYFEEDYKTQPTWNRQRINEWLNDMVIQDYECYEEEYYAIISTQGIRQQLNYERMAEYINDAIVDKFICELFNDHSCSPNWLNSH